MASLAEYNQRLADLFKAAEADGHIVNLDGKEGCPPCNTVDEEDSCVGCPYRLRDLGIDIWSQGV